MRLNAKRRAGRSFPVSLAGRRRGDVPADAEQPILAELFSVERLEQHAATLAAAQPVRPASDRGTAIRPRVAENGRVLLESYRVLARAIKDERSITPAAEWLVDNFHIVDEQLREIRDDLPPDYYRELPKLAEGHLAGLPAGPRSRLGLHRPHRQPLRSREPAADGARLPGGRAADDRRAVGDRDQPPHPARREPPPPRRADRARAAAARQMADELADSLLGLGKDGPDDAAASLRRLHACAVADGRSRPALPAPARSGPGGDTGAPLARRARSRRQGTTAEEMVRVEHQRQATMNVTVRNVITSMRLISWFDWAQFVESVSLVDEVLRDRSAFGEMDFATRDRLPERGRGARPGFAA